MMFNKKNKNKMCNVVRCATLSIVKNITQSDENNNQAWGLCRSQPVGTISDNNYYWSFQNFQRDWAPQAMFEKTLMYISDKAIRFFNETK